MRLLARYLLRECVVALGYCFSAFLLLWITFDLLSELNKLQENKMRVGDVAEYYLFKIPEFLPIALPMALLLALLYALSNHARHNEITAMRAAGIGLWRLSLPYFAVGLLSALALFASNELLSPRTEEIAEDILTRRLQRRISPEERRQVKNLVFFNSRENRSWHIGVYNRDTTEMANPDVIWELPDGSRQQVNAQRGVYTNGSWTFFNVRGWKQSAATNAPQVPIHVPSLALTEFGETPEEIESEISISERYRHQSTTRSADIALADIRHYLRLHPKMNPTIRSWLETKMHGRLAGPFICLVVVLLALPAGAAPGRRNVFVGVAASLGIFFAYFILQQLGFALGEAGRVPAWLGAWIPNLLFAAAGLWMIARVR